MGLYGLPMYNPVYGYGPVMRTQGLYQPATYIPVVQAASPASTGPVMDEQNQNTRSIIKFQAFQEINQRMVAQTAATTGATPPTTTATQEIVGTVQITQNPLTNLLNGNDAAFKINIQSSGNPAVAGNGARVILAIGDDCVTVAPTGQTPDRVSS